MDPAALFELAIIVPQALWPRFGSRLFPRLTLGSMGPGHLGMIDSAAIMINSAISMEYGSYRPLYSRSRETRLVLMIHLLGELIYPCLGVGSLFLDSGLFPWDTSSCSQTECLCGPSCHQVLATAFSVRLSDFAWDSGSSYGGSRSSSNRWGILDD